MESALCTLLSALVVLLCSSPECKGEDTVTQPEGDASVIKGTATINCTFTTSDTSPYLYWYKQEGHGAPQYMMRKMKSTTKWQNTFKASAFDESRFKFDAEENSVYLKIQDVRLCCVLLCSAAGDFGNKLIFATGNKLLVQTSDDLEPSYYPLEADGAKVCLATGFTLHDKLKDKELFAKMNGTFIARETHENDPLYGLYSQVALIKPGDEDKCPESSGSSDDLQPDPAVNLLSLTVLGLRILFIKTVAFNVLLTLRFCISR